MGLRRLGTEASTARAVYGPWYPLRPDRTIRCVARLMAVMMIGASGLGAASAAAPVPPAPDYRSDGAWLALPHDRAGQKEADTFYVHPTTTLSLSTGNAPARVHALLDQFALANQASVFDECCRVFAPRYRQARLRAGGSGSAALDLAYADVDAAFEAFLTRIGPQRPFIIAGHSQGSGLALRLIAERIAGRALARRLVVAYLPGAFVPRGAAGTGLTDCASARQTGCIVTWNSAANGHTDAALLGEATFWRDGAWRTSAGAPALCVNPLDWRTDGVAGPEADVGSMKLLLDGMTAREPNVLVAHLTGAACLPNGALAVTIRGDAPSGFHNMLAILTGSEHLLDYNLFYGNLVRNVSVRIAAWRGSNR